MTEQRFTIPRTGPASGGPEDGTLMCPACGLSGGPFAEAEAGFLLAVHDALHHGVVARRRRAEHAPEQAAS